MTTLSGEIAAVVIDGLLTLAVITRGTAKPNIATGAEIQPDPARDAAMADVAVVVIGRNEARRLRVACGLCRTA